MNPPRTSIHVAGTGLRGSGYPNAPGTLAILRGLPGITVHDRARWLPEGTTLWRKAGSGVGSLLFLARLAWLNALEAIRVLPLARDRSAWVYAPYPSIFLLWWLSWLPRRWRPRVVADAYVSLWDAAFRDRGVASEGALVSRLFRRFEARALRAADRVHVDTVANRDWFIGTLGIAEGRIRAIPLALQLPAGAATADAGGAAGDRALKVLFIGTLVPLHGVGVIAGAAARLVSEGANVEFTFVGDGQDHKALDALLALPHAGRVAWIRDWQDMDSLGRYLREADVCLGVFGGEGKASRVLPFKVYLALAAGKAVVTQAGMSMPQDVPPPPLISVPADADRLAEALRSLVSDRARLAALSRQAGDYFAAHLSAQRIAGEWLALLNDATTTAP